ncbi:hypothetical protein AB0F43_31965 [Kribbella sp. NPDC023972]|uniref:hypothetical protein n=1 Tax=Kribbella sp. NPDC023972 TaxID=3154795 RepID=UPI0033D82903
MEEKSPVGSRFVAIAPPTLLWAVGELCRSLTAEQLASLKVSAGEHLAAILTTTFLACAPVSIDSDGGTDLTFDFSRRPADHSHAVDLGPAASADFEIKSFPGGWRKYGALVDKALAAGRSTDDHQHVATFRHVNDVLREEGRSMIRRAKEQLDRKSKPGRSKNVFLIANLVDQPIIEFQSPILAYMLDPLDDIDGIDSVWVLWAPGHLVVWSAGSQTWTDLVYTADDPQDPSVDYDENLDFLQQVEQRFLDETGCDGGSPYLFRLTAG